MPELGPDGRYLTLEQEAELRALIEDTLGIDAIRNSWDVIQDNFRATAKQRDELGKEAEMYRSRLRELTEQRMKQPA